MPKTKKKGSQSLPLKERILHANTWSEVKDRIRESESLEGEEKHPNGSIRFHGPTGMVSIRGADAHKPKRSTIKQILLLMAKAGLLTIILFSLYILIF